MIKLRISLGVVILIMVAAAATPSGATNSNKRANGAGRAAANGYATFPDKRVNVTLANACVWTGANSIAWANAANWSGCGGVTPGEGDTVTIGAAANQPLLTSTTNTLSTITVNAGGTFTVMNLAVLHTNASFILNGGTLIVTGAVVNIGDGTAETNLLYAPGSALQVISGSLNVSGRLSPNAATDTITYNQSGGTVTVAAFGSTNPTFGSFSIPAAGSSFTMSAGDIVHSRAATAADHVVLASSGSVTGGRLQFGDGRTLASSIYTLTSTPQLFDLTIANTNADRVNLGGNVTVTHSLTLSGGNIVANSLGNFTLSIAAACTVSRTAGYIIGNENKTFSAPGAFRFDVGTPTVANYSPVDANVTAGAGNLTVSATQTVQPNVNAAKSLKRYWTLAGVGITTNLQFNYLASDAAGQGIEANYKVIRVTGGIPVALPSSVNTASHFGTVNGVSNFSDWTLGEVAAPTAAPARVSGQVMATDGRPLGGVVVSLNGSRTSVTITDGNGQYQFANVETDGFYTVTPALANYHFAPASRSFSLLGDKTDAIFMASPDAAITANPIDTNEYFVRQQYLDFLNREPDPTGFAYWVGQLNQCLGDPDCTRTRRLDVSAAFFGSEEFQQTGSFVFRLYRSALGRQLSYSEFSADRQQVVGGPDLAASKAAFVAAFVERPEFALKYQNNATAESFVDALLLSTRVAAGIDLASERNNLIARYNSAGTMSESRSQVVGELAESASLSQATYNQSFVLMEYFGYLQRDSDPGGYDFWLNVLENGARGDYRGMVCAFMTSAEYQRRFSPAVTRGNGDCR